MVLAFHDNTQWKNQANTYLYYSTSQSIEDLVQVLEYAYDTFGFEDRE